MVEKIRKTLLSLGDENYKAFTAPLLPSVPKESIIGVRTPKIREYAKVLLKENTFGPFLKDLPHLYYEENTLHATIIARLPFERFLEEIETLFPYLDNWGTCDGIRPKYAKESLPSLLIKIEEWLTSQKPYTLRFAILMLMTYYLDGAFEPRFLNMVAKVKSDHYYVKMMVAWYFATALAKQYEATVPYLENKILPVWTHNKALQKAIESYRITPEQKDYFKTLKIKAKIP